ncbi:hypothetical protein D4764_02G0001350 [Takifugu flavidus]|uniref:Uncharacterized protein n=1 Tax=Takifugu flavidus TaxID=433684 RepID=A0A5C6NHV7_9TELE|nr:hypothetical protein D4764_02G0001350 [Takifugu flavidus]
MRRKRTNRTGEKMTPLTPEPSDARRDTVEWNDYGWVATFECPKRGRDIWGVGTSENLLVFVCSRQDLHHRPPLLRIFDLSYVLWRPSPLLSGAEVLDTAGHAESDGEESCGFH